jgi:hypothetical protein
MSADTVGPALDARLIFLQGVRFEYASRLLSQDLDWHMNNLPAATEEDDLPSGLSVPPPESGVVIRKLDARQRESFPPTLDPLAVNVALTTELYLKTLVVYETGDRPKVHPLAGLFAAISEPRRKRIEGLYEADCAIHPQLRHEREATDDRRRFELVPTLERNSHVFSKQRYSFERPLSNLDIMSSIAVAIRQVILEAEPGWKPVTACLETLPTLLHPCAPEPVFEPFPIRRAGSQ